MADSRQHYGLTRGLTNYGDRGFALYLRRSFAKSMGYSDAMLARPTIGIANTSSGFNNCHRHFPELLQLQARRTRGWRLRRISPPFHLERVS